MERSLVTSLSEDSQAGHRQVDDEGDGRLEAQRAELKTMKKVKNEMLRLKFPSKEHPGVDGDNFTFLDLMDGFAQRKLEAARDIRELEGKITELEHEMKVQAIQRKSKVVSVTVIADRGGQLELHLSYRTLLLG